MKFGAAVVFFAFLFLFSLALWLGNARDSLEAEYAATSAVFTFLSLGMLVRLFVGRACDKRGRQRKGTAWAVLTTAGVLLTFGGAVFGAAQPYDHVGQTNGELDMDVLPSGGGTSPDGSKWYLDMQATADSEGGETSVDYTATTDSNTMQQLPAHQKFEVTLNLPDGETVACATSTDQTENVDRYATCAKFVPWWTLNESTLSIVAVD